MERITSPVGATVSYDKYGSGPPWCSCMAALVTIRRNWEFVDVAFCEGIHRLCHRPSWPGETDATEGHSVDDESWDVAGLIKSIGKSVFLLGHSYGAQIALAAAAKVPDRVRKLVLYEPPWPHITSNTSSNEVRR